MQGTCEERHADAAAFDVASTALPSLMQSLVSATAAATASALMRAACAKVHTSKKGLTSTLAHTRWSDNNVKCYSTASVLMRATSARTWIMQALFEPADGLYNSG